MLPSRLVEIQIFSVHQPQFSALVARCIRHDNLQCHKSALFFIAAKPHCSKTTTPELLYDSVSVIFSDMVIKVNWMKATGSVALAFLCIV
jgi:hypothetical protein